MSAAKLRTDRLLTLQLSRPFLRLRRLLRLGGSSRCLPILMYHSICDDPEIGVHAYFRTVTSRAHFAWQMAWLRQDGWVGVTLRDGLQWLQDGAGTDARRPVALTFDDGFRDFHDAAFPILQTAGFGATVYLATGFVGHESHRRFSDGRECLMWDEVLALQRAGVEFGSHTVNHPVLTDVPSETLTREIEESKHLLEQRLGTAVESFAYPYAFPSAQGAFIQRLQTGLRQAGYRNCVTTAIGRARADGYWFSLPRLPVNQEDDHPLFEAKLSGAYDWMGGAQACRKALQRACGGRCAT